jgi:hypothetical protein
MLLIPHFKTQHNDGFGSAGRLRFGYTHLSYLPWFLGFRQINKVRDAQKDEADSVHERLDRRSNPLKNIHRTPFDRRILLLRHSFSISNTRHATWRRR